LKKKPLPKQCGLLAQRKRRPVGGSPASVARHNAEPVAARSMAASIPTLISDSRTRYQVSRTKPLPRKREPRQKGGVRQKPETAAETAVHFSGRA
jgi:hypothetical protein